MKKVGFSLALGLILFLFGIFNSGVTEASVDTTPPKFMDISFSSTEVPMGKSVIVYIDAEDQETGIAEASLMLRSPSGLQSEYLWLNQKDTSGRLFGELQVAADAELGLWEVGYISIEDNNYNYWKYFYQDGFAYDYDNVGNMQYLEVTPYTIKIIDPNQAFDIMKELHNIENQSYDTIEVLEKAFVLVAKYEEMINSLSSGVEKDNLLFSLSRCKIHLVKQFEAITQGTATEELRVSQATIEFLVRYAIEEVKATSIQDKGKILGFLKPILKSYTTGNQVQQVIDEYFS